MVITGNGLPLLASMTSSRSTRSANGDQLAVAAFRLTHCFHRKLQRGEWHFEKTVSPQSSLEKGRCPSWEPWSCSERPRSKNRFRGVGTIITAKSHYWEPLKSEKVGLHLCRPFKNLQVNVSYLALLYLRSNISQTTEVFPCRQQSFDSNYSGWTVLKKILPALPLP